ncbi:Tn5253 bacteriocine putative [Streptococcus pneumoniae]|nr:Tn5253 bacteriocine putative [Streptococcus pneumoniae]CIV37286.1 Tn5253 bacteriocine putative [Streptococcus pneumoniae]
MKVVNLYDLKQMGNKGGCTIQLIHHFPECLKVHG